MLANKINLILEHIAENQEFINYNKTIFEILEGDLLSKAERALRSQLLSDRAFTSAKQRIAPINIIKRITEKLTKIYSNGVERKANDEKYQEIVDYYVEELGLNDKLYDANLFFNCTKAAAIEPYEHRGQPKLRVVPPHLFLMYSDDVVEPNSPTVYIKFMGIIKKLMGEEQGKAVYRDVDLFFLYSQDEFLAIDSDGDIAPDYMINDNINPFSEIPAIYANKSKFLLVPKPDQDLLSMQILIVLLLTDLAFGIKYQAHSIFYGINLNVENFEMNPDSFLELYSTDDGSKPEIGSIKPEIDIESTLNYISTLLDMWLESRNIKAGNAGRLNADNAVSGISLMIKEMDTTLNIKDQMRSFKEVESEFWRKMIRIHNYWLSTGVVTGFPMLPDDFSVNTVFTETKPIEDSNAVMDRVLKGLNKVMTLEQALMELYPKKTPEEIENLVEELQSTNEIEVENEESELENAKERSIVDDENQQKARQE